MANRIIPDIARIPPRSAIVCAIVAAAIVLGGGGSSAPRSELILQLVAALAAAAWLVSRRHGDADCPPGALAFAALIVALPVVQLIPLPPGIWRGLPGRTTEAAVLDLVDAGTGWMPWTVSPSRTWGSLLATLPVAFIVVAASMLDRPGRRTLLVTIAALGVASLLLGALQLADGIERTWRFYVDNPGYLNGFQANRNAEADVLLIAFAALAGLLGSNPQGRTAPSPVIVAIGASAGVALLLGCVLTGSRAGIALIVPVVLLALLPWRRRFAPTRRGVAMMVGLILVACLVLTQTRGGALALVVDRFSWNRDVRMDLWRDTLPVVQAVWPMGSGIGTFQPMFIAGEPLRSVDPTIPVRAHNDYLEFVLEGGVVAVLITIASVLTAVTIFVRGLRRALPGDRGSLVFVASSGVVIALHSLVDYPLRSMAIATLGAAALGVLIGIVRDGAANRRAPSTG